MEYISTSALANELDIKSADLFDKLKTLGWIERKNDKWLLTELGKQKGGQTRNNPKFGEFVVWPENISLDGGQQKEKPKLLNATDKTMKGIIKSNVLRCLFVFVAIPNMLMAQDRTLDPRTVDPDRVSDQAWLGISNVNNMFFNAYYDSTEKIYRYFPYSFTDSSGFAESWKKVTSLFVNSDKSFFEEHWQVYMEYGKTTTSLIFKDLNGKGKFSFTGNRNIELKKNVDFSVYPAGRVFEDAVLIVQNDPDSAMLYSLDLAGNKQELLIKCSGNIGEEMVADMGKKMLAASITGNRLLLLDLASRSATIIEGVSLPFTFKICNANNKLVIFSEGKFDNVKPEVIVYTIDLEAKKVVAENTWKGKGYLPDQLFVSNSMQYLVTAPKKVELYSLPDLTCLAVAVSPQLLKECHIVDSMDASFMIFKKNITARVEADIAKYQKEGYSVQSWNPDFNMNKDYVYKYMIYCAGGGTPSLLFDVFTNLGNYSLTNVSQKMKNVKPVERFKEENIVRFEADVTTTAGYYGKVEPSIDADPGTFYSYYNFHKPFERIVMKKKKTGTEINAVVMEMPREQLLKRQEKAEDPIAVKKKTAPAGKIECPACGGTGEKTSYNSKKCPSCSGGKVRCTMCGGGGRVYTRDRSRSEYCQYCHGAGSTYCYSCGGKGSTSSTGSSACKSCNGTGYISAGAPKR